MIVDLNLNDKLVVIIGGGKEAQKRINSVINQNCKIIVISEKISPKIARLAKNKKIEIKKYRLEDPKYVTTLKPDIIITTTDDQKTNEKILKFAKTKKIIAYSSDNPEKSDFSNPAIVNFEDIIQVAIFTGGRSPAMSKQIKSKIENLLELVISEKDIQQIKIQKIAREFAKKEIVTQTKRKEYLNAIMNDNDIDQLIKDGQMKKAEKLAIKILRDWK